MKCCIIGLGSMGKRRIRALQELFPSFTIIGIDTYKSRCDEVEELYRIAASSSFSEISKQDPDAIFVCTSPEYHTDIFSKIDLDEYHTFSELDLLSEGYQRLIDAEKRGKKRHFLSSTNLFDLDYRYIMGIADGNVPMYYRYHVGQYLKDWHPWESYKVSFFGHQATNGCREILAIELPWIIKAFGPVSYFNVIRNKISGLDIDFNDGYFINFRHQNGSMGQLTIDVVSRIPVRELEVFSEEQYLKWSGHPYPIYCWKDHERELVPIDLYQKVQRREEYGGFIVENPYMEETKLFIDSLSDSSIIYPTTYAQNFEIISLIDELENQL